MMEIVLQAACASCNERGVWHPRTTDLGRYRAQRNIWAETHRNKTGHMRFYLTRSDSEVLDFEPPTEPDQQLRLSDDPNYSTFKLGEGL